VSPHTETSDDEMAARGLHRVRLLHQLRRALPVTDVDRRGAAPLAVRPFRAGVDDEDWLKVNNRAFSWHPDQGGWDAERLRARLAEPWVRLDGFLVHDGPTGALDGFCWTKLHPADLETGEPELGEIFVIAADPDTHGTGLGRALVLAGLDWLAAQGPTVGMLYTEADNEPAMSLYSKLGFTVHHSDAGYAP
jgi:mycothiol synthase